MPPPSKSGAIEKVRILYSKKKYPRFWVRELETTSMALLSHGALQILIAFDVIVAVVGIIEKQQFHYSEGNQVD